MRTMHCADYFFWTNLVFCTHIYLIPQQTSDRSGLLPVTETERNAPKQLTIVVDAGKQPSEMVVSLGLHTRLDAAHQHPVVQVPCDCCSPTWLQTSRVSEGRLCFSFLVLSVRSVICSIMNSLVIVLFLSGMVAMIMLRTLHKDIARYNQMDNSVSAAISLER